MPNIKVDRPVDVCVPDEGDVKGYDLLLLPDGGPKQNGEYTVTAPQLERLRNVDGVTVLKEPAPRPAATKPAAAKPADKS